MNIKRINQCTALMKQHSIEQIIITDPTSIFYLTGEHFECGERCIALLLFANGTHHLLLNDLFIVKSFPSLCITSYNDIDNPIQILGSLLNNSPIGIDGSWPSRFLLSLIALYPHLSYSDSSFIIEQLRAQKDLFEIEKMKNASSFNDQIMSTIPELLATLESEQRIAKTISQKFEKLGASQLSFDPIIAYGQNSTNPHHEPTQATLEKGDSIIVDMGGVWDHYCSDMTRTFFYGFISEEAKKIYDTVLEANLAAINAVKPGVTISSIDAVARNIITQAGYGDYFTHRTGHGIGLCVHEAPSVSASDHTILLPGMCFSIEPGIYKPGVCGVRIEDLVLVTENGVEVLNSYPKDLTIINP